MINKTYPNSVEAEMAVLGTMLVNKDSIETIIEILKPEHFYLDTHKIIFETILKLNDSKKSVDIVIVSEELKKINRLDDIGGMKYLTDLVEKVSSPAHAKEYANIVKEKYILRELIRVSTQSIEAAYDSSQEIDAVLDYAQKGIFDVSQKNVSHSFVAPKDLANNYLLRLQEVHKNRKPITGIPSGFSQLDFKTGGFQNSEFIIIAARPSQGKTALALNIAYNIGVSNKIPVIFFSLEMDKYSLINRFIASSIKYDSSAIRRGAFPNDKWQDITTEVSKIYDSNIWIDDTPGLTIMDIRARARKLILDLQSKDQNLNKFIVIIDYLQLIRGFGKPESRQQEVSEISRLLKDMARSLNIPVIALSQLNRRTEDRSREGNRPQLSDLRESGSLEQDSDVVVMIHRDYYYSKDESKRNDADLIIAKNRNGAVGDIKLLFHPEWTKFSEPLPPTEKIVDEEIPL
ncbi:MAG: replicative DNA helicase [Elusimicrobiales bacterium]|jgi:replicative DNA helicase|nr:replicative DNA helicase [Elusimicrobiales bacterium]NLH40090.1 replicative DNA helicase [Elusimicrobiota bacterium]